MIDGGGIHGLALKRDGTVLAWGGNSSGQLGDGTNDASFSPVQVQGLGPGSGVVAVSAGYLHSMALKADGTVLAWGENVLGQLGNGSQEPTSTPVVVGLAAGAKVVAIAAGFTHSLALREDGTVWCWGRNGIAGCGIGNRDMNVLTAPVQVHGEGDVGFLENIAAISAGSNSSMALTEDGKVYTWGNNNNGQVGNGTASAMEPQLTPFKVLDGAIAIGNASTIGANSAYAVLADGTVLSWGNNNSGQLGDGTTEPRSTPGPVSGLGAGSGVTALALGQTHGLARKADGTLVAWGNNSSGQLGNGTIDGSKVPVPVTAPDGEVVAIAGGGAHSYALTSDGRVWAWGDYASGQLGNGASLVKTSPVQVYGLGEGSGVEAVAAGGGFALARKADGTVLSWGDNSSGQLGDDSMTSRPAPVPVATLGEGSGVTAVSAGLNHALALKQDGTVLAWGNNINGQLGTDDTTPSPVPVPVTGLGPSSGVIAVVAGRSRSFALKGDGTVLAWGQNNAGTLGDGTDMKRLAPIQVHGKNDEGFLDGVVALGHNQWASYALRSDGEVVAWGYNGVAAIGDGTRDNTRLAPVQVHGLDSTSGVTAIGAYYGGGFALKSDGTLVGWGHNVGGPVGNGDSALQLVPVQVSGLGAGSGVASVVGGTAHTMALRSDGTVLAWGDNSSGTLGDGTTAGRLTPAPIAGLSGVRQVAAFPGTNGNYSLALLSDGEVLAWGANTYGQLGDNTVYTGNRTPALVMTEEASAPEPDAGVPPAPDAGVGPDARPAGATGGGDGCDCRAGGRSTDRSSAWFLGALLTGLALVRRRRPPEG